MSKLLEKRIILLRHGITHENKSGIIQGQTVGGQLIDREIDLRLTSWLNRKINHPAIIVSSDTRRAIGFARGLSKVLKVPLRESSLFRQRNWGVVEGKRINEISDIYAASPFYADANLLAYGAESLHEVTDRSRRAINHLSSIRAKTIIVVTHDEFSNYLVNEILNERLFRRPLAYNEAHIIDYLRDGSVKEQLHMRTLPLNNKLENRYIVVRKDAPTFLNSSVGIRILKNKNIRTVSDQDKFPNELIEGIVIGDDYFTEDDLRKYPNLKVVARFGMDCSNIQIKKRKGLFLVNTAACSVGAVAEFTIATILNLIKNISIVSAEMRGKNSNFIRPYSKEYSDVSVGVMGMGSIGKNVAQLLNKLGFRILVWTRHLGKYRKYIKENNFKITHSLEELFKKSDIVTLHIRLCNETRKIIGANKLKLMSPRQGCIVNVSRIELIDYQALLKALNKGWIRGVAIDARPFERRNISSEDKRIIKTLFYHKKVVATPHIAGRTSRAIEKAAALTAYNIGWIFSGNPQKASLVELS